MPKLLRSWTILINGSGMFNLAILFNLKRPNKLSVKFILYSGHLFTTLLFFVYYRTTIPERSSEGTRTGIQTRPMSAFVVTLIPTPSRREGSIGALLPATHMHPAGRLLPWAIFKFLHPDTTHTRTHKASDG